MKLRQIQCDETTNSLIDAKEKVSRKLESVEALKAKHLAEHKAAEARHRWIKAAHLTQHSKLRATIDLVMELKTKSASLKAKAEADREIASKLMQHACDHMGFMPNGAEKNGALQIVYYILYMLGLLTCSLNA